MADYTTKQRRRNLIVGGFVLIGFALFIWMLMMFGDLPLFAARFRAFEVLVTFPSAPGVQRETPVRYCGYQIGRVVSLSPPEPFKDSSGRTTHKLKVTMAINRRYTQIPSNVDVLIMKRGLGSSYIEMFDNPLKPLVPLDPERPETMFLTDKIVMDGDVSSSSEFFPPEVQQKLVGLMDSITALADSTNVIVGDKANQQHIKDSLANISAAAAQANETLVSFRSLTGHADKIVSDSENVDNFKGFLANANQASGEAVNVMADAREVMGEARQTMGSFKTLSETTTAKVDEVGDGIINATEQLDAALSELNRLLAAVNSGQGSTGKMIHDGRLYENLLDSSEELQMALEQIKEWAAEARDNGIRIKW